MPYWMLCIYSSYITVGLARVECVYVMVTGEHADLTTPQHSKHWGLNWKRLRTSKVFMILFTTDFGSAV